MSGGHFDYLQDHIGEIAEEIEDFLDGHNLSEDDLAEYSYDHKRGWISDEEYEYVMEHKHTVPGRKSFSEDTIKEFENGLEYLRKAEIYAQRIDWLLSGDDGEENFHTRLKEELEKLKK